MTCNNIILVTNYSRCITYDLVHYVIPTRPGSQEKAINTFGNGLIKVPLCLLRFSLRFFPDKSYGILGKILGALTLCLPRFHAKYGVKIGRSILE